MVSNKGMLIGRMCNFAGNEMESMCACVHACVSAYLSACVHDSWMAVSVTSVCLSTPFACRSSCMLHMQTVVNQNNCCQLAYTDVAYRTH